MAITRSYPQTEVHSAVARDTFTVANALIDLQDNKMMLLTAIHKNGLALESASHRLRNDKPIVKIATQRCPAAFAFASEELQNDKQFVLSLMRMRLDIFEFVSVTLKNDMDVICQAVMLHNPNFNYISGDIKGDKQKVLTILSYNGNCLHYVGALKNDRDIVLGAVRNCGSALRYAPSQFRKDKQLVLVAIQHSTGNEDEDTYNNISDSLKNDKEVILACVTKFRIFHKKSFDQISNLINLGKTLKLEFSTYKAIHHMDNMIEALTQMLLHEKIYASVLKQSIFNQKLYLSKKLTPATWFNIHSFFNHQDVANFANVNRTTRHTMLRAKNDPVEFLREDIEFIDNLPPGITKIISSYL